MIKFGFGEFQTEFPNWSKHHKTLGIRVKRAYKDGEEVLPKDPTLKAIVVENEELLKSKHVTLSDRNTSERKEAVDYYLPLQNLEYPEANIEYYSVGAMNTKQTTHIRLTFLLDYDKFILDYSYKSSGSFATNFFNFVDGMSFVEDVIEEVLEQEQPIEEVGITKGEDEDYNIVLVTEVGEIMDIEIEKRELLNSLVGVEVYQFDMEIVSGDDTE